MEIEGGSGRFSSGFGESVRWSVLVSEVGEGRALYQ